MKVTLRIQPVSSPAGTMYYASDDGQVILSLQGPVTWKPFPQTMEVEIPVVGDLLEVDRLTRFLTRIASSDEITGDGPVEEMTTGPAARELQARIRMAQRALDGKPDP